MRLTEQIMGLPISIDIPSCSDETIFKAAFNEFKRIDNKFSTYKKDSEVSRFASGELNEQEISDELKDVIAACHQAEADTDGFFSAWAGGQFDPSGYVKGWAIQRVSEIIESNGFKTYCISAGGDLLARSDSDKVWNVGIQDPVNKNNILNQFSITNGAVATSGNYERGHHIINPKTGEVATELLSVTITGPDIITADVLATAVYASGEIEQDILKNKKNYKALVVAA